MSKRVLLVVALLACVSCLAWIGLAGTHIFSGFVFERNARAVLSDAGVPHSARPRLSVGANGTLYMLALYGDADSRRLGMSVSHDGGDSFMPVTPVSEPGANIAGHGEAAPAFVHTPTSTYVVWQEASDNGDTRIMVAHGDGMGHRFDPPVNVIKKDKPSFNGFASIAAASTGEVYVAWLDARDGGKGTFSVYVAKSTDKGKTFGPNIRVADSACPCCRPAIAVGAHGEVHVAWRKVFDGNIRDMIVATSTDHAETFAPPVRVAEDNWVLNACPDSGPTMAVANGKLFIAWHTEIEDRAMIHLAVSSDGGRSFGETQHASGDVQDPNHPVLKSAPDGQITLAFQGRGANSESDWSVTQPFVVRVSPDGAVTKPVAIHSSNSATYPDIAAGSGGVIYVAWTKTQGDDGDVVLTCGRRK